MLCYVQNRNKISDLLPKHYGSQNNVSMSLIIFKETAALVIKNKVSLH